MSDDVESINGWTPPVVQDWQTGKGRIATQEDFDRMARQLEILSGFAKRIEDAVEQFRSAKAAYQRELENAR